ncbi:hypothetical protein SBBP2_100011 [Burkholderiales bacterium]|nr:hypothetical protein SBBP2_100011 [Burkholderiales bacterium]
MLLFGRGFAESDTACLGFGSKRADFRAYTGAYRAMRAETSGMWKFPPVLQRSTNRSSA